MRLFRDEDKRKVNGKRREVMEREVFIRLPGEMVGWVEGR
jgi:hypothetical protein